MDNDAKRIEAFISDNYELLDDFTHTIHHQVDYASSDYLHKNSSWNNGELTQLLNSENLYAATWETTTPDLPTEIAELVPFEVGEPIKVHTRYRYGLTQALINIWLSNPEGEPFQSFGFSLAIDPTTGEEQHGFGSNMSTMGSHEKSAETNTKLTNTILRSLFAENEAFQSAPEGLDLASRYRLGIMTQADYGAELYTVESAEKSFGVPSKTRNVDRMEGFKLRVELHDRTHPNRKPSITHLELGRAFDADYESYIYDGRLSQILELTHDENDTLTHIGRRATAMLFSEPIPMYINGKPSIAVGGETAKKDELPPDITAHMYPDTVPTIEDIEFFKRLSTQPITEQDVYFT